MVMRPEEREHLSGSGAGRKRWKREALAALGGAARPGWIFNASIYIGKPYPSRSNKREREG
jgi:hypothetical protein